MDTRNARLEAELPHLRRYARALATDADAAGDLVQDTMIRALRGWDGWSGTAPLRHWLFTIMRNRHVETRRRVTRWRSIAVEGADVTQIAAPGGTDPVMMHSLSEALKTLSDTQRETLFLVAVEGLSYAETAELMGTATGTVMSRLARARATLRSQTGGLSQ